MKLTLMMANNSFQALSPMEVVHIHADLQDAKDNGLYFVVFIILWLESQFSIYFSKGICDLDRAYKRNELIVF